MTANPFQHLWGLGYRRLVPILPPGVPISERSSLHRALAKGPDKDPRGKAVGVRGHNGDWYGLDWITHVSSLGDCATWADMGAGVGIKTGLQSDGTWLLAIDADTVNAALAKVIGGAVVDHFGKLHVRIGRAPKAAYLIRTAEEFRYARVEFDGGQPKDERVEILSDGRQMVALGIHPATMKPYAWPDGVPALADIPITTPDKLRAFMDGLARVLPAAKPIVTEGSTAVVDQAGLKGDLDTVRKAVSAIPNTSANFPTRDSYRDFGYALKAALPDHPDEALDLFQEWAARWVDPPGGEGNDPDVVASDWRRMKGPFRRGASYVYGLAQQHSSGAFNAAAELWFDEEAAAAAIEREGEFGYQNDVGDEDAPRARRSGEFYETLSLDDIFNLPKPRFVIDRHIPELSLGFLYGAPGAGKSFVALCMSLHVAFGLTSWNGDAIASKPNGCVIYVTGGEGTSGIAQRVEAWMARHDIAERDRARFRLIPVSIDFLDPEAMAKLAATLRQDHIGPVSLIVVDTISRAMPGADENLQKEMTLFVQNCDRLKTVFRCSVLGVHHSGKAGDLRGSTVLLGAGDYVFKLERKKGSTTGRLHCEKQKDAPDGWSDPYRFDLVPVADGKASLVPIRVDVSLEPEEPLDQEKANEILEAMRTAWNNGAPWGQTYHSKALFVENVIAVEHNLAREKVAPLVENWLALGIIAIDKTKGHHGKTGFKVVTDANS